MSDLALVRALKLPANALDASANFLAEVVPVIRDELSQSCDLVVLFAPADHTHDAWRLAAIQELAREAAPLRVNAIVGDEVEAVASFLANAPGVTGQVFETDGN